MIIAEVITIFIIVFALASKFYAYKLFYREGEVQNRLLRAVFFATWLEFGLIAYSAISINSTIYFLKFYIIAFWLNALNFGICRLLGRLFKSVKNKKAMDKVPQ